MAPPHNVAATINSLIAQTLAPLVLCTFMFLFYRIQHSLVSYLDALEVNSTVACTYLFVLDHSEPSSINSIVSSLHSITNNHYIATKEGRPQKKGKRKMRSIGPKWLNQFFSSKMCSRKKKNDKRVRSASSNKYGVQETEQQYGSKRIKRIIFSTPPSSRETGVSRLLYP